MRTILLVDDEPVVLKLASMALENAGYDVLPAAGAQQAISLFEGCDGQIDLLLTDVVMPGMDGPELAETLVARKPGLPVLLISGIVTDRDLAWKGATKVRFAFLRKPFQTPVLIRKVRETLGEKEPEQVRRATGSDA